MTRRALNNHLRDERGQGLAVAMLVMLLISILVVGVLAFTETSQRHSAYSKSAQVATTLADAGINNAASVLAAAAVSGSTNNNKLIPNATTCQSTLLPSSLATANSSTYAGGSVKWWGSFDSASDCQNWVWTLHSQATVANPTGTHGASIVKNASAQVQVHAPKPSSFQVGVWNTVYSPGTGQTCDTTIGQGINISVPVYVGGNLCMGQNAVITKPVYVGGNLFFNNKQGSIGSSGALINSAHVGGWCQVSSGAQVNPCQSEPVAKNAPDTNIWVQGAPTNLTGPASDFAGITAPTICWGPGTCTGDPDGGWYTVASPGPLHPCTVSSGTTPTFDNDTTMNRSVLTTFNLTPAASYTCQTPQGELSWNATTRVLTVAGTVFIDGNVTMTTSGNQPMTYTGWGSNGNCTNNGDCQSVIYASGDISINSEKLCAVLNSSGTDCNWNTNAWDPNKKILIFASNGPNGVTVGPSQTSFQGGLYATNTVSTGQSAITEGPLVSGTKTVVLGQQFGGTFPSITILPLSIQQPPGAFWIDPAKNFG
jgi:Tfp pilus assembly protein PilX/carbonic anhydrase/acetyltransferase-like protein (isoleucine patch superfamily)